MPSISPVSYTHLSADIDGFDICNKLRISASIAYDYHVPDNFPVFGIRTITKEDVQYFKSLGMAVRLIAKTKRQGNTYSCVVEPILFKENQLEANTMDNYNLITLHGDTIGDLKFFGQGAGKLATANAVVQDILDILEGKAHRLSLIHILLKKAAGNKLIIRSVLGFNSHKSLRNAT